MMRWLQRLFWLGVLVGGGYCGYRAWSRRQSSTTVAPQWPPMPVAETETVVATPAATSVPRWLAPVNGTCPDGYPIKANDNSRIFHVPGGRFYERTAAERCYANADDAIADGYRPAKA